MFNLMIRSPLSAKEWQAYYKLRWQVLRAPHGQLLGSEQDELEAQAFHGSVFTEQQDIVGVGRLHRLTEQTGQIRYMAVAEAYQRQGIGIQLLNYLESIAINENMRTIKLNARENALPFYLSSGYQIIGEGPLLYGVITHKWMIKELNDV